MKEWIEWMIHDRLIIQKLLDQIVFNAVIPMDPGPMRDVLQRYREQANESVSEAWDRYLLETYREAEDDPPTS